MSQRRRMIFEALGWVLVVVFGAWVFGVPVPGPVHVLAWVIGLPGLLLLFRDNCREAGFRPWKDRP